MPWFYRLGSIQNLCFFLGSWFPHRLESEDHTMPWFYPKLVLFFIYIYFFFPKTSPSTKVGGVSLMLEAPRAVHAIDTARRSP